MCSGPWVSLAAVVGFLIAVYLTFQKLVYHRAIGGRPLLLLAILLIFIGFQFITMGLIGRNAVADLS